MFDAKTEVVQLESRLGRVGSIQGWNPWDARRSVKHAKWWVSKVASLSYGNDAAKDPEKLFQGIVDRGHLSCLEFVPMLQEWEGMRLYDALPAQSLRARPERLDDLEYWGSGQELEREMYDLPEFSASAFLVECPLYTRSQWIRHRSLSYLELSRRYTKGSKVEWTYCGDDSNDQYEWDEVEAFHRMCEREYLRRLEYGWPNEIARGCMPMEAMTRFWVAGFDRDWEAFLKLRDDAHAQPEIQVFASWIRNYLKTKKVGAA